MGITFLFQGTIADIDDTTPDEPCHPATALIVEVGNAFARVIVPNSVLQERLALLCAGRPVQIVGELALWTYDERVHKVASHLSLSDATN
jgi:hypothetical protein